MEEEEEAKSQLEGPPVGPPGRDGPQAQVVFTGPKPKLPPLGRQLESWFGLGWSHGLLGPLDRRLESRFD